MKKMILMTVAALLVNFTLVIAQSANQEPAKAEKPVKTNGPVATYDKTTYEFADLTQGIPGTATFNLTNSGNEPLIISAAHASCGCTNLTYSKDPILPGKTIPISATYNAAVVGPFTKTVTVTTNADTQPVVLMLKGKVNAKAATDAKPAESQPVSK